MEYNCFEGIKFEDMSKKIGDRKLAFNLLMPDLEKTNSPEYIALVFFVFVNIIIIRAFLILRLEPFEAWDMVHKTWPYFIIGGIRIGYLCMNWKRGLNKLRISSGNPGGILFWMFLLLIELGLVLSVLQTSGFVHRIFLGLVLIYGVFLIVAIWLTEKGYLTYDKGIDRHRWLLSQIPQEEVRWVAQAHHGLKNDMRYKHKFYTVPAWSDEEIDRLIEISWRRKRLAKLTNFYDTLLTILILFPAGIAVTEFSQVNGIFLPFGKGRTEWFPQVFELPLIILFIASGFLVLFQGMPIKNIVLASLMHILIAVEGVDSMIYLLVIGYALMIWKGAINYFKYYKEDIIRKYKFERSRLSFNLDANDIV